MVGFSHPMMLYQCLVQVCMFPSCLVIHFCLSQFSLQFLSVCLPVDEGAEDEVGPLHSGLRYGPAAAGVRCKFLTPSISVSVPDDEPYNSDEENYVHLLFSSEWTEARTQPSVTAQCGEVLLRCEGEQSTVPLFSFSPPTSHTTFISTFTFRDCFDPGLSLTF